MVLRQLMVIEVVECRIMNVTYVDYAHLRIREVGGRGLTADDWHWFRCEQDAAREHFVFVGTAGMRKYCLKSRHGLRREFRDDEAPMHQWPFSNSQRLLF